MTGNMSVAPGLLESVGIVHYYDASFSKRQRDREGDS